MKRIIDEKGRIFGRINVIDFVIIVLIVSILPMFYFGAQLASYKKPIPPEKKKVKLEVQIKFPRVMLELAPFISEGDTDGEGGYLKKITVNKDAELVAVGENDQVVIVQDFTAREITATFNLSCIEEDGYVKYRSHIVKIGNSIAFSTDLYTIQGFIVGIKR